MGRSVLAMIALGSLALSSEQGQPRSLEDRFRAEFPAAMRRNLDMANQMSGSGTISTFSLVSKAEADETIAKKGKAQIFASRDLTGGTLRESKRIDFALDGPLMKRTIRPILRMELSPLQSGAKRDPSLQMFQSALCVSRDSAFWIDWPSESGQPVLKSFAKSEPSYSGLITSDTNAWLVRFAKPTFVPDMKNYPGPDFAVKALTPSRVDGVDLLRVDFELRYTEEELAKLPKNVATRSGWFVTRPDDGWVIQECLISTINHQDVTYTRVEFGDKQNGVLLPKKIFSCAPFRRQQIEFDSLRHGPTPESEFTLAAFGLPSIDKTPTPADPNRTGYWLVGLGGFLLVGVIGLKIAGRRNRAAA